MVLLVGTAAVTVAFYARGTYFVALDHAEVTIYKGRPGGLLWFHPTVVRRTGVQAGDIQPVLVSDLRDGVEEASLRDAERYVASLKPGAPPATTTSATTTAAPTPGSSTSAP
jgi:protein phosphatase